KLKRRITNRILSVGLAGIAFFATVAMISTANAQSGAKDDSNRAPGSTSAAAVLTFSEDFSIATAFTERFDHGWSGEWNAGSMFQQERNDWHADHGMMCENPNTSHRIIHLTSQQQANDAAFYHCLPDGDPAKGHLMTSVNTEGYVTVWFSP